MFAAGVVEAVDVVKESVADLVARYPSVSPNHFSFEGFEEGLDGGIVIAVASTTHGHFEA